MSTSEMPTKSTLLLAGTLSSFLQFRFNRTSQKRAVTNWRRPSSVESLTSPSVSGEASAAAAPSSGAEFSEPDIATFDFSGRFPLIPVVEGMQEQATAMLVDHS